MVDKWERKYQRIKKKYLDLKAIFAAYEKAVQTERDANQAVNGQLHRYFHLMAREVSALCTDARVLRPTLIGSIQHHAWECYRDSNEHGCLKCRAYAKKYKKGK